jgi:hypothetical protein
MEINLLFLKGKARVRYCAVEHRKEVFADEDSEG